MKTSLKMLAIIWVSVFISLFASILAAKEEDLVLYFKFDDVNQNVVLDHSGNENHGNVKGEFDVVDWIDWFDLHDE